MQCPACDEKQHSIHVDGNMKLYRFKSAGVRKRDCYYEDAFIAPNEKVDEHINKVYKGSKQNISKGDSKCGDTNWRAAGNALQKKKNLVETGLEIAGCRHALAQKAVNMFHGEVYGYAHFMQVNYFIPQNIDFFWYDVVCKYWPWLEKHDRASHDKMKPALSVFHAKAHSWSCQSLWGGRWQQGACATTGEEVELINSHFSRLGSTTKHMLPEGREELLTEHAFQWNQRKIDTLANALARRYKRTENQLQDAQKDLDSNIKYLEMHRSHVDKTVWKEEVLDVAKEAQYLIYKKNVNLTSDEESFLRHILTLQSIPQSTKKLFEAAEKLYGSRVSSLKPQPCSNVSAGETLLKNKASMYLRKCIEGSHNSITQMALNMGKLADSSKQRKKLRNKISKEKVHLKELVTVLNGFSEQSMTFEDAEKGCFYWQSSEQDGEVTCEIPIRTKRVVVDKFMEVERFEEELVQIRREMLSYIKFYANGVLTSLRIQLVELDDVLKTTMQGAAGIESTADQNKNRYTTSSVDTGVLEGKKALTMEGINFAMHQITTGITAFAPVLEINLDAFREITFLSKKEEHDQPEGENGEEEDDDVDDDEDDEIDEGEVVDTQPVDVVLHAVDNVNNDVNHEGAVSYCPVPGVYCWRFPDVISQGRYNGRNGSNACSIISLLLGYFIQKKNVAIPSCHTQLQLPGELIDAVCGCINLGNDIYDMCRESLPSRYLSVEEAATVLRTWYPCSVEDALPVRLTDDHEISTLRGQLARAALLSESTSACIIMNERTSLYHLSNKRVMYIDTHNHGSYGLIVVVASISDLKHFCKEIWNLEGHNETTFGNLVFLKFM